MGGGGTSSSGNQFGFQNTTSTTTPDPMAYNYLMSVLNMGANVGGIPYQPYTGQQLSGFTQDQLAAMQGVRNSVGAAQPYIDQATQLAAQAYNLSLPSNFSQAAVTQYLNPYMSEAISKLPVEYTQDNVAKYYDPRLQAYLDKAPMTYSEEAVNRYYNPYQQQVIDATKAGIEQQNAQQMAQQQAQAIQAGAFGGDRSGAARAQLAGQQALSQNQVLGGLRQQGYQNALSAFQQQQAQALGIAGQEASRAQGMFQQQQAAGLNARQQAYSQALAQYNQQQAQAIQAAQQASYGVSQLGAQSQQAQLQGLQALLGTGQLQQQLNQQQLNNQYSQWLAAQSYPYMQTAFMAGLGGLAPGLGGTTNTSGYGYGSSNQQQSGGSSLGQIGGLAQMALGMFGLSDERAKTNIDYVGKDPESGDPLYAYDYKSDVARSEETGDPMPPKRVSAMAQDVAERHPEDVVDLGGLLGVKLGREGRAGGGKSSFTPSPSMQPIYTHTGEAMPSTGYSDLSSIAYPVNPNLSTVSTSGIGALFTPYEEYEKIGKRWVSPKMEEEEIELKPFRVSDDRGEDSEDREERAAGGGMFPDQSDFLEMSKSPPYGLLSDPKVASAILPIQDIPVSFPKTPDLGYIPGLPGGAKGQSGGGGGGGGEPSIPKIGQKSKPSGSGSAAIDKSSVEAKDPSKPQTFTDKLSSGVDNLKSNLHNIGDDIKAGFKSGVDNFAEDISSGLGSVFNPSPSMSLASVASDTDSLGGLGKLFGGLFNEGGRVGRADGGPLSAFGNVTGSQLSPVANPYGPGVSSTGSPFGLGAFNTPINTGISVQQAFGPQGLGRPIPQSLANFRMPWSAVNTGSSAYNNMLLQAAQNIGPRQLTPQEFGLPGITPPSGKYLAPPKAQIEAEMDPVKRAELQNQADIANLQGEYPSLFSSPSNYIYQMTDWTTPEGLRFMAPMAPYTSPSFYVNPYAKTPAAYKADGGAVRPGYRDGGKRNGLWGRFQDAEEGARAAALAIKEDVLHPQEVLHSIWNRVKSGMYGDTPSDVMSARRQYEPLNPSNRGTSRDPRTMNPNDPKVRELSSYWNRIKSGEVEDPTKGATHFMNPDIVGQRRHGHFKPWERQGLSDPSSVQVGKQIFYNPSRDAAVASDRPMKDYFANLKPPIPYGPGDKSILAGGYGKYGDPIPSVVAQDRKPDVEFSDLGIMDTNPGDPTAPYVLNTNMYGDQGPTGSFANMPMTPMSAGEPSQEMNKVTEVQDGESPVIKTTSVGRPNPNTRVVAEKTMGFGPVKNQGGDEDAFDLGSIFSGLFGDDDKASASDRHPFGWDNTGSLQGFDLEDLGSALGFSHGGRVGYEGGGRAKEAWDYLINEAGASPAEAEVLVPAAAAESAFDPTAIHDQGTGFGLFGHRLERADALRKSLGEKASDFKEQLGFGLKEFRGRPEHSYIEKENPTLEDVMQAHGAFERPAGYKTGSPEGMMGYGKRRALTEAAMRGDFDAFGNYKGSAGSAGGDQVVAKDRGDEKSSDDMFGGLRSMLGGDKETEPGLFGMKPMMNRDLAMFLLASGAGMAASRSRSPLQALGEGGLQGIEAMQASRVGREAEALKSLQAQNIMSEVQKRNFELNELIRKTRARQQILGSPSTGGAPVSSDTGVVPPATAMPSAPEAPKIVEEAPPVSPEIPVGAGKREAAPVQDPYDVEMEKVAAEEKANRAKAQQFISAQLPEEAKQFEERADKARDRRERLMTEKRKSLTEKVDESSPMGQYQATQTGAATAVENSQNLKDLEGVIQDPNVDFGIAAPYLNMIKSGTAEAEEYFPALKKYLPEVNTAALAKAEKLGAEGNKLILAVTNGKLGGGVTDADMRFLKDTTFNISKTREYNMGVLRKAEAVQNKLVAAAEEQERYRQSKGGLDANFQAHMAKWGQEHPVQSFMRKTAEHKAGQIGEEKAPVAKDRTIVKRGKSGGRPVVQYSDGTIEYAD